MGTYYTMNQGQSFKEFVADELSTCEDVITYSIVSGCAYILYGKKSRLKGIEVWKLTRHDGCPGYKPMSEEMGPYYHDCPKRILDAADPTTNETANEWRAACHAKRERKNLARRIKPGDIIETESGAVYTATLYWTDQRKSPKLAYRRHTDGRLYRLPRLANAPFWIVEQANQPTR